jgi:hypothetical protein
VQSAELQVTRCFWLLIISKTKQKTKSLLQLQEVQQPSRQITTSNWRNLPIKVLQAREPNSQKERHWLTASRSATTELQDTKKAKASSTKNTTNNTKSSKPEKQNWKQGVKLYSPNRNSKKTTSCVSPHKIDSLRLATSNMLDLSSIRKYLRGSMTLWRI